jgi:hypothetical protein
VLERSSGPRKRRDWSVSLNKTAGGRMDGAEVGNQGFDDDATDLLGGAEDEATVVESAGDRDAEVIGDLAADAVADFRDDGENPRRVRLIQSTSTSTSLPSTMTGKLRTPVRAGGAVTAPVFTLNFAPCRGHSTVSPFSSPSPNGPPRWVQVFQSRRRCTQH